MKFSWHAVFVDNRGFRFVVLASLVLFALLTNTSAQKATSLTLHLNQPGAALNINKVTSLSVGGLDSSTFWADRGPDIQALKPKIIRFFAQEYMDEYPAVNTYSWTKMDAWVDLIHSTGADALVDITFKPKVLYPVIDPSVMYPNDWTQWDNLIYNMVLHYKQRGTPIRYWEFGDECEIGEDSGCPYQCDTTAKNYNLWYDHMARAVKLADSTALVGGPAASTPGLTTLPDLLTYVDTNHVPIDFVSWHNYTNDPHDYFLNGQTYRQLLAQHPSLGAVQTFLGEWNMDLFNPPTNPQFQPTFIAEAAYWMKQGGVDLGGYYHIRDIHVSYSVFSQFMTPAGAQSMVNWWDGNQVDGIYDFNDNVRPSYYSFQLLSQLTGSSLPLQLDPHNSAVHGLATYDSTLQQYNLVLTNFSNTPARVTLNLQGASSSLTMTQTILDASSSVPNAWLQPQPPVSVPLGTTQVRVTLGKYGESLLTFIK